MAEAQYPTVTGPACAGEPVLSIPKERYAQLAAIEQAAKDVLTEAVFLAGNANKRVREVATPAMRALFTAIYGKS